jgi:group I intron endonuclease
MNSGIYHIKNLTTGMVYYGRTVDWVARKRRHLSDLRSNRHKNPRLQHSWNSRNENEFEFSLVWPETKENLDELESFVLDFCFDSNRLYNCHKNSVGGFLGQKHSEETKRKWSEAKKGTKMSEQAKRRQAESRASSKSWADHIERMRQPEMIAKAIAAASKPEVRAKALATRIRNGHKPTWEEARQKQIEAAKVNLFNALDWAVTNTATRNQALKKFNSSWGSLKKFQSEWETINGPLNLPKHAFGEKNGKVIWSKKLKNKE